MMERTMMERTKKKCPLMKDKNGKPKLCLENKCAWWSDDEERCAITLLAFSFI